MKRSDQRDGISVTKFFLLESIAPFMSLLQRWCRTDKRVKELALYLELVFLCNCNVQMNLVSYWTGLYQSQRQSTTYCQYRVGNVGPHWCSTGMNQPPHLPTHTLTTEITLFSANNHLDDKFESKKNISAGKVFSLWIFSNKFFSFSFFFLFSERKKNEKNYLALKFESHQVNVFMFETRGDQILAIM